MLTMVRRRLLSDEELRALPVSSIREGWKLTNGDLYLFVRTPHNVTQTLIIKKERH